MPESDDNDIPTQPLPVMSTGSGPLPRRPFVEPLRVEAAGLSHRGKVRKDNQDHYSDDTEYIQTLRKVSDIFTETENYLLEYINKQTNSPLAENNL